MSDGDKRELLRKLLAKKNAPAASNGTSGPATSAPKEGDFDNYSYDLFLSGAGTELTEGSRFAEWVQKARAERLYAFEAPRLAAQRTSTRLRREDGAEYDVLNFSSYNYLGYGVEPTVVEAAKEALDRWGLGAASSPAVSGYMDLHVRLEGMLADAYNVYGHDYGATVFSSGYGVNLGAIPAIIKQDGYVVLDAEAHMSLVEGAKLSGGRIRYFRHNDADHLRQVLGEVCDGKTRVLVCLEGVYSASGDIGAVRTLGEIAKERGAMVLVDEAHSSLLMGDKALGVVEHENALDVVDFIVLTFSKAFGAVGGALLCPRELVPYFNWFSRTRFFSCALDPAVTGGLIRVCELGFGPDGDQRRRRLHENAARLRRQLEGRVPVSDSRTWLLPVIFGADDLMLKVYDWLQSRGLDTSVMGFPATPKNQARARIFVTSEHTAEQLDRAADLLAEAGETFGFALR